MNYNHLLASSNSFSKSSSSRFSNSFSEMISGFYLPSFNYCSNLRLFFSLSYSSEISANAFFRSFSCTSILLMNSSSISLINPRLRLCDLSPICYPTLKQMKEMPHNINKCIISILIIIIP